MYLGWSCHAIHARMAGSVGLKPATSKNECRRRQHTHLAPSEPSRFRESTFGRSRGAHRGDGGARGRAISRASSTGTGGSFRDQRTNRARDPIVCCLLAAPPPPEKWGAGNGVGFSEQVKTLQGRTSASAALRSSRRLRSRNLNCLCRKEPALPCSVKTGEIRHRACRPGRGGGDVELWDSTRAPCCVERLFRRSQTCV